MYDFSRKSFTPHFSKSCLFPSYGVYNDEGGYNVHGGYNDYGGYTDYGGYNDEPLDDREKEWKLLERRENQIAYFERIFICIGIIAFILGSIISIWTNFDPEFKNLHKAAPKENDYEMSSTASSAPSRFLITDAADSFNNKSNRQEESIVKND